MNAAFVRMACCLCVGLVSLSCGGTTVQRGPRETTSPTVVVTVPSDPVLADVPPDVVMIAHADVAVLRRTEYFAVLRGLANDGPLAQACDGDPLAQIDQLTASWDVAGPLSVVIRGPITDDSHTACAEQLARFLGNRSTTSVHVGDALLVARVDRLDVARAPLEGGANANANPTFSIMRRRAAEPGIAAYVYFPPLRERLGLPPRPPPALDRQTMEGIWNGAETVTLSVAVASGNAIAVNAVADLDSREHATQLRTWLATLVTAGFAELRGQIARHAGASASDGIDAIERSFHLAVENTELQATLSVDASTAAVLSAFVIEAFRRYEARGRTSEARANVDAICRGAVTSAQAQHEMAVRLHRHPLTLFPPSAARTPMDVPAGVAVVDPPATWQTPTWTALGFSLSDPHRYSYEFVNQRERFTVRAYGDLDGDGVLSTFERSGRIDRNGEVTLGVTAVTNELE